MSEYEKFLEDYNATITKLEETSDGVNVTIHLPSAKLQSLMAEQQSKKALFDSILRTRRDASASDFCEEL